MVGGAVAEAAATSELDVRLLLGWLLEAMMTMKNTSRVRKFILIGVVLAPLVVCLLGSLAIWAGQERIGNFPKGYAVQACVSVAWYEVTLGGSGPTIMEWSVFWSDPADIPVRNSSLALFGCRNLPWMPFFQQRGAIGDYWRLP